MFLILALNKEKNILKQTLLYRNGMEKSIMEIHNVYHGAIENMLTFVDI